VAEPASTRSVEFHPRAEAEYLAELDRLLRIDPLVAGDFDDDVNAGVALILDHPQAGPAVGRSKALRKKVLGKFRFTLIYAVDPDLIRIIAVAHHSRRPGYWRDRLTR
jgi:toxin ParE1/3/4